MLEDFTGQPLLGVRVHLATIRHLARVRLTQAPQRLPHRLLRRVPYPHVLRVLDEVRGRHAAPVALVDGDIHARAG